MCGIAGLYNFNSEPASRRLLLTMAGDLLHRGPDGVGLYLDASFGMVNTRLSIIDIEGGDQPISNETGRFWAMQNGEIYNHIELRAELERLGHRFTTRSDTEVIVHAYEEWGEGFLDKINGEFALAVFDQHTRELFLARDRFGIRPLFVTDGPGYFAFASEAKALLRHPMVSRRINPAAVLETFAIWSVLPDRSAFEGVRELPPGHFMSVLSGGLVEPQRWWDLKFEPRERLRSDTADDLAEELRDVLEAATKLRLRADVPVGVYLSGGLDSAATTALAQRHARGPLEAFAVAFEDQRFDESDYQIAVAEALGVNLNQIRVSDKDVADVFPEVVRLSEKPMLRTSPGPLLLLSRLTRDTGFKVVLTGEGADEILGGYQVFQEAMVRRFWARQPESHLRPRLLGRLYPYLSRDLAKGGGFMAEFFRSGMQAVDDPLYSHRPRFRSSSRNLRLLTAEARGTAMLSGDPLERLAARLPANFRELGPLSQAQYLEVVTFMSGFLLSAQGDRMLMGNSVEGRYPFLDVNVASFASAVPESLRMRGISEKYLFRRAMQPILPKLIYRRPKRPYRAPISRPFIGPQRPEFADVLLAEASLKDSGIFNPKAVGMLIDKAERNMQVGLSESDEMGLVGVLSTMLLKHQFVDAPERAQPAYPMREVFIQ